MSYMIDSDLFITIIGIIRKREIGLLKNLSTVYPTAIT